MRVGYFSVKGENCKDRVIDFIQNEFGKHYRSDIIQGSVFFLEDYSVMTNSDLMFCIKAQLSSTDPNICEIEVVCGGGGDGFFSIRLGNEGRRIDSVYRTVAEYCFPLEYAVSDLIYRK